MTAVIVGEEQKAACRRWNADLTRWVWKKLADAGAIDADGVARVGTVKKRGRKSK